MAQPLTATRLTDIMRTFGAIPGMGDATEIPGQNFGLLGGSADPTYAPYDPFAATAFTGPDAIDLNRLHQEASSLPVSKTSYPDQRLIEHMGGGRSATLVALPTHNSVSGRTQNKHMLLLDHLDSSGVRTSTKRCFELSNDGKVLSPTLFEVYQDNDSSEIRNTLGLQPSSDIFEVAVRLLTLLDENYAPGNSPYKDGSHPLRFELLINDRSLSLGSGGTDSMTQLIHYQDLLEQGAFTLMVRSTLDAREIAQIDYLKQTYEEPLRIKLGNFTRPDRGERAPFSSSPRPVGFKGEMVRKLIAKFV